MHIAEHNLVHPALAPQAQTLSECDLPAREITRKRKLSQEFIAYEEVLAKVSPDFFPNLMDKSPELSRTEIQVASLTRLSLGSEAISRCMGISKNTVSHHQRQIRVKLRLGRTDNIRMILFNL